MDDSETLITFQPTDFNGSAFLHMQILSATKADKFLFKASVVDTLKIDMD